MTLKEASPRMAPKRSSAVSAPAPERADPESARRAAAVFRQTSWSARWELELSEWIQQGRRLGALGRATNWWLGDWVRYGNARYGERYDIASRITGYEVQSLMNMAYVASRFEISRRRETLSWSHHAELAALTPEEQELWLDRAEAEQLSVLALRLERRIPDAEPRDRSPKARALAGGRGAGRGLERGHAHVVCPNCGHGFHHETDDEGDGA
jgi:signal transduction histidine kinase